MRGTKFSVVIPTKNRARLLNDAIRSVLAQTYGDFELIVVNNADAAQADETARVVASHADPRLRYFRTGGLTMADNWEAGVEKVTGELVLFLEDKSVLKPHCLAALAAIAPRHPGQVITWTQDSFDDISVPPRVIRHAGDGSLHEVACEDVLARFVTRPIFDTWLEFPLPQKSCIPASALREFRAVAPHRSLRPYFPDVSFSFQWLATKDTIVVLNEALSVFGSRVNSLGFRAMSYGIDEKVCKTEFGAAMPEFSESLPFQACGVSTTVINEYYRQRPSLGGRLLRFNFDSVRLFVETWYDILRLEARPLPVDDKKAAWHRGVRALDRKSRKRIALTLLGRPSYARLDSALLLEAAHLALRLRAFVRLGRLKRLFGAKRKTAPKENGTVLDGFATPLEYVLWEAQERKVA